MATTENFSVSPEEITSVANIGKDMMLDQLVREGFLSKEQAGIAKRRFFVILHKKHWLSGIFTRKKDEDNYRYVMVKTDTDLDTGNTLVFKPEDK